MRFTIFSLFLLAACSDSSKPPERPARAKPVIYTVNYPLQYFAQRIGGDLVDVRFPAPADEDPAFWKPGDETIADYQRADLILLNGAGYARWVKLASLPEARLVDTSAAFRDRYIAVEGAVTHSHGPEGEHEHGDTAITTWLDFTLAVEQARAVKDAFVRLAPEHKAAFETGFAALDRDLSILDEMLRGLPLDLPLLASHPVYQYFARRYEANLRSVHWEPNAVPDEVGWDELKEILKDHPAKWMLWEKEPLIETRETLESLGIRSIVFDPCGNKPDTQDLLTHLTEAVRTMSGIADGERK